MALVSFGVGGFVQPASFSASPIIAVSLGSKIPLLKIPACREFEVREGGAGLRDAS